MPHLPGEAVMAAARQSAPTTSAPPCKQHLNAGLCFRLSTAWFWRFNSRYFLQHCFGSRAYQRADSPPTWQACTLIFLDLLWRIKKGRARSVTYDKAVSGHLQPCHIGTPKPGGCVIKRWGIKKHWTVLDTHIISVLWCAFSSYWGGCVSYGSLSERQNYPWPLTMAQRLSLIRFLYNNPAAFCSMKRLKSFAYCVIHICYKIYFSWVSDGGGSF